MLRGGLGHEGEETEDGLDAVLGYRSCPCGEHSAETLMGSGVGPDLPRSVESCGRPGCVSKKVTAAEKPNSSLNSSTRLPCSTSKTIPSFSQ